MEALSRLNVKENRFYRMKSEGSKVAYNIYLVNNETITVLLEDKTLLTRPFDEWEVVHDTRGYKLINYKRIITPKFRLFKRIECSILGHDNHNGFCFNCGLRFGFPVMIDIPEIPEPVKHPLLDEFCAMLNSDQLLILGHFSRAKTPHKVEARDDIFRMIGMYYNKKTKRDLWKDLERARIKKTAYGINF